MKLIRNIVSVSCVFTILISVFCMSASAITFSEGDFGFEINTYLKTSSLVEYTGKSKVVQIPSGYSNYKLTSIKKSAFNGNSTAEAFNIPTTVTSLDSEAFYGCSALKSITILPNITSYGVSLFQNCTSLESASVLSENTKLPNSIFRNCSSLTDINLSEKINTLGSNAFADCVSLKEAPFLSQISVIGEFAFYNTGLEKITLSDSVKTIPAYAFANCENLSYAVIPASVTSIDNSAFYNDANIILGVYKNSYALQYAEENQIDHIILDGDKIGDVNGDGVVDILDATEIQKYAAESTDFTDEQFELGDINKDGYCDVIDALLVQKSVIGAYEIPQNIIRY